MAPKKIGIPYDFQQLEIIRARAHQSAGDPATPVSGQYWYDSVANKFKWQDNTHVVDPLARGEHTGTQLAATISDFNTAVRTNRLDQLVAPTGDLSIGGQKLTNVAAPTAGTDGANKSYVDATSAGRDWKDSVRVASTANINLASPGANIDAVAMSAGERFLAKNQTAGAENGIYIWNGAAVPATRATDMDVSSEVTGGVTVSVEEGTANADTRWILTTNNPIVLGTTALTFSADAGEVVSGGAGLTKTGTVLAVGQGTGVVVNADDVAIDPAIVARWKTALIGDGAATSIAYAHNLNNQWANVQVIEVATLAVIDCDIVKTDANTVTLIFAVAPANNAMRVTVIG